MFDNPGPIDVGHPPPIGGVNSGGNSMAIKLRLFMIVLAAACVPAPASQAAEPEQPTLRERIAGRRAGGEGPVAPLGAGTHALQMRHGGLSDRKSVV